MTKPSLIILAALSLAACTTPAPSRTTAAAMGPAISGTDASAGGGAARVVNVAIGTSVPSSDPDWNIKSEVTATGGGPTRRHGGEVIGWAFFDPDTGKEIVVKVAKIRLIGYSAGGKGQVLVHLASVVPGAAAVPVDQLFKFAAIGEGSRAKNYNGLVLLGAGDSVVYTPPNELAIHKILFTLEGFSSDDASVAVQLDLNPDPGKIAIGFGRVMVNGAGGGGIAGPAHPGSGGHHAGGGGTTPTPSGGCHLKSECGAGFSCGMDGKCRAEGGDHQGCQNGGTCERSGDCCSGDCNFGHCRSASGGTGGPGDPCTYNSDCYSQNCGAGGTCKAE